MWLVAPLVVDYSASHRLVVVDYFASAARPGASARRAARHAALRAARRRLLHLAQAHRQLLRPRRASECLGTSRGSSCASRKLVVDYSASTRLVVDYSVHRNFLLRQHWPHYEYATCCHDVISRSHRVDHSS
jgi:hypothetical protein